MDLRSLFGLPGRQRIQTRVGAVDLRIQSTHPRVSRIASHMLEKVEIPSVLISNGIVHNLRPQDLRIGKTWGIWAKEGRDLKDLFMHKGWKDFIVGIKKRESNGLNDLISELVVNPAVVAIDDMKENPPLRLIFDDPFVAQIVLGSKAIKKQFEIKEVRLNSRKTGDGILTPLVHILVKYAMGDYGGEVAAWDTIGRDVTRAIDAKGLVNMNGEDLYADENHRQKAAELKHILNNKLPFKTEAENEKIPKIMKSIFEQILRLTAGPRAFPLGIDTVDVVLGYRFHYSQQAHLTEYVRRSEISTD